MNRKLKTLIPLGLICIFMLSSISFASPLNIYNHNEKINLNPAPIIRNNRTLVPLRAISETMGFPVGWDNGSQTVFINKDCLDMYLTIGSKFIAFVEHGEYGQVSWEESLDVEPVIINQRIFLPLRVVSESLGVDIKWDGKNNSIFLN